MEIEEVITEYLLSQPAVTTLISKRFFFEELPQGTELPAVICIKVSDIKGHTLTGMSELERPVFQLTALAKTKAEARRVATALKTALSDYQGDMSGLYIQKIELQNELSSLDTSSDGLVRVYTEDLEFEINYTRRN